MPMKRTLFIAVAVALVVSLALVTSGEAQPEDSAKKSAIKRVRFIGICFA